MHTEQWLDLAKKSTRLWLAFVCAAFAPALIAAETDWKLEEKNGDISVYMREVENSRYRAVKATVQLDASAERVAELMGTGDGCVEWRAMCKSSRLLEVVSETERYVYMVLDLPWPMSDRDLVIHTTTDIDPEANTVTVNLQSASERHPPEDYVRAEIQGQFVITALDEETVDFTYIMHTELGGGVPVNMVNSRLKDSAIDDLARLQDLAEG